MVNIYSSRTLLVIHSKGTESSSFLLNLLRNIAHNILIPVSKGTCTSFKIDATPSGVADKEPKSQAASMISRQSSLLTHMASKWKRRLFLWVGGGGGVSNSKNVVVRCGLHQMMHLRTLERFKPIWGGKGSIQPKQYFVQPLFHITPGENQATITQVLEAA